MIKRVVYTALFGPHEALTPQDAPHEAGVDYLCFTDDPALTSNFWTIIQEPGIFPADPRRSQRFIKIRGHKILHEYDEWLYLDNTVRLKVSAQKILEDWLDGHDWAAINLTTTTLWQEFEKNLDLNKDSVERINEQLSDYSTYHLSALAEQPVWNGMFARKNTEAVRLFCDHWFRHVCRYSARDQLSMIVALSGSQVSLKRINASTRNSVWHDWPHRAEETAESKANRHARSAPLEDLAQQLKQSRARTADLELKLQELRRRRFFGAAGVIETICLRRRARERQRRQDRKRKRG